MVEDGRLGRPGCWPIVMAGDGVQELCEHDGVEVARTLLDRAQTEVDVAEEAAFLRLPERRTSAELADPPDVVQEPCGEQEVVTEPAMELCRVAAERRHADDVLEETTRVPVVAVGACGGKRAERRPNSRVPHERVHEGGEPRVGDLRGEELEEAVELVRVAPERRRQLLRVRVRRLLDGPDLELEPSSEALDVSQDADCVPLPEPRVEKLDVTPDARVYSSARIGELEREVRRTGLRPSPLLPGDREHSLDGPVLGELGDRGHGH